MLFRSDREVAIAALSVVESPGQCLSSAASMESLSRCTSTITTLHIFTPSISEDEAVIGIEDLAVIAGGLRPRALSLVAEWADLHREELRAAWRAAKDLRPIGKIALLAYLRWLVGKAPPFQRFRVPQAVTGVSLPA